MSHPFQSHIEMRQHLLLPITELVCLLGSQSLQGIGLSRENMVSVDKVSHCNLNPTPHLILTAFQVPLLLLGRKLYIYALFPTH